MFACCSSRSCLGKRGNTVSECDLEVFFSQKCQTPAECVVNVFTAECKVLWYCTYTAMSAVVFQGHRSPLAFFMDILQYISIKYKDIIISFSYGDSPPHRSSSLPTPPLFTSITLVSPPPSFLLSLSVLLCLSVTDTLFLFFSIKDETFPPA